MVPLECCCDRSLNWPASQRKQIECLLQYRFAPITFPDEIAPGIYHKLYRKECLVFQHPIPPLRHAKCVSAGCYVAESLAVLSHWQCCAVIDDAVDVIGHGPDGRTSCGCYDMQAGGGWRWLHGSSISAACHHFPRQPASKCQAIKRKLDSQHAIHPDAAGGGDTSSLPINPH